MSEGAKTSDNVRALAAQAGLGKAFALAPDIVAASVERGHQPLGKPPAALTLTTSPAPVFDPSSFETPK